MVPLQRTSGCWVEELPSVLWSINTTPNRSMGYTPFFMVYELRQFSLVTSVMTPLVWRLTLKLIMNKLVRMHLTC